MNGKKKMRKNEIIEAIANVIHYSNHLDGNWSLEHSRKCAKDILHEIEMKGMVSQTEAKVIRGVSYPWGGGCNMHCNCDQCNPEMLMPEWEKEYEEK